MCAACVSLCVSSTQLRKEKSPVETELSQPSDRDSLSRCLSLSVALSDTQVVETRVICSLFATLNRAPLNAWFGCVCGVQRMPSDFVMVGAAGFKPAHIRQGGVGDCWFLAALAVVAERGHHLLSRNVLTTDVNDHGHYLFRLFIDGNWRLYSVDDHLPVRKGRTKVSAPTIHSALALTQAFDLYFEGPLRTAGLSSLSESTAPESISCAYHEGGRAVESAWLCGRTAQVHCTALNVYPGLCRTLAFGVAASLTSHVRERSVS